MAGSPTFVVRSEGTWVIAAVGEDDDRPITFTELLELVGLVGEPAAVRPAGRHLSPDATVEPFWQIAGRVVVGDGVAVEGVDGRLLVLDAGDLQLLDALTGPATVGDLDAATGLADAGVRIARLVDSGRLLLTGSPSIPDQPAPADPAVVRTAPRRRRLRRHRGGPTPANQDSPAAQRPVPPRVEPNAQPDPPAQPATPVGGPSPGGPAGRVPVYAIWHPQEGPLLSLGMLTASARRYADGALNETYEIRRPETAASFMQDLATRSGPAVLLCSDYVWTLRENLAAAREALRLNPELVVIHGGPSSPKYEGDAQRFMDEHHDVAHVLTRGEGEHTVCELLTVLAPTLPRFDPERLAAIQGLTFRSTDGGLVRTPDRDRIAELDTLPSPYLTGEFDHIPADQWNKHVAVETNRGCPYGCTFCDWGSSTLSRIRMFDPERVAEEIRWAARRGIETLIVTDANFGIMSRDVESARQIADIRRDLGFPLWVVFFAAKNTTKHLIHIMDVLGDAGIVGHTALSLQTVDQHTLDVLDRSNISTDHFVALAAEYRRRGHPLQGDLLLGMPGQTYEAFGRDLQFMFDHEILSRVWPVQVLPNSPMNDPVYRAEHGIECDDRALVVRTASFTPEDRARMVRLRRIDIICERYGLLRHVMRWLQWDHGIAAAEVMDHLLRVTADHPDRYPHLTWILDHFDHHPVPPVGWTPFYDEVRDLVQVDFGIAPDSALDAVMALNQFLMPTPGRSFPDSVTLQHDYAAYYRDATDSLFTSGHAGTPPRPLRDYPSAPFTVDDDPLGLCTKGIRFAGDSRSELDQGEFQLGAWANHELESPLIRVLPGVANAGLRAPHRDLPATPWPDDEPDVGHAARVTTTPLTISRRNATSE